MEKMETLNGMGGEKVPGIIPDRVLINMSAIKLGTNSLLGVRQLIAMLGIQRTNCVRHKSNNRDHYTNRITCPGRSLSPSPAYAD